MSGELPHTGGSSGIGGLLFVIVGGTASLISLLILSGGKLKLAAQRRFGG